MLSTSFLTLKTMTNTYCISTGWLTMVLKIFLTKQIFPAWGKCNHCDYLLIKQSKGFMVYTSCEKILLSAIKDTKN